MTKKHKKNWKTTLCGIGALAAGTICPVVGVPAAICGALSAFFGGAGLILSKDHDVTGGNRQQ